MRLLILMSVNFLFLSCTIYRSPERKNFESEYNQFKIQNYKIKSCSHNSIAQNASASKLIYITPENISIWEHIVNSVSIYESNDLKGDFCLYENNQTHT